MKGVYVAYTDTLFLRGVGKAEQPPSLFHTVSC